MIGDGAAGGEDAAAALSASHPSASHPSASAVHLTAFQIAAQRLVAQSAPRPGEARSLRIHYLLHSLHCTSYGLTAMLTKSNRTVGLLTMAVLTMTRCASFSAAARRACACACPGRC